MEVVVKEAGVPVPEKKEWRKPIDELEVGESFLFEAKYIGSVRSEASGYFKMRTNKRFHVSIKDQPEGMARVWRIEDAE